MAKGGTRRRWGWALLIGLIATTAVLAGKLAGLDERAELAALDVRLRQAAETVPLATPLLYVEIDDGSIERVGRWPWPRETLAGLVSELNRCGAERVVLDLILPDPQPVRFVHPGGNLYAPQSEALFESPPVPVFDDAILARALGEGECYLPFHLDVHASPPAEGSLEARVLEAVVFKRDASLAEIERQLFPTGEPTARQREVVRQAYLLQHGRLAMERFALRRPELSNMLRDMPAGPLTPPMILFARAVSGSGFVNIQPDLDGVVRRVSLLGFSDGEVYPQLAYNLSGRPTSPALDERDRMLVRWYRTPGEFRIPAGAVVHVRAERQRLERLDAQAHALRIKLLTMGFPPERSQADFAMLAELTDQADAAYRRCLAAQRQSLRDSLYAPAQTAAREALAKLRQIENQLDAQVREHTKAVFKTLRAPEVWKTFCRAPAEEVQPVLDQLERIPAERAKLSANLDKLSRELRSRVENRTCLVGSTSTGAADFVPTPLHPRTPGVRVHGNALLTMRNQAWIRRAGPAANGSLLVMCGALVSVMAACWPVLRASVGLLVLLGASSACNVWVVFGQWGYWLDLVAPVAAMLVSFLAVTVYRQLTEERAKRRIRNMFAHALSSQLVDQLLEDPALVEARNRPITCMFTDLAGFTPLSGQLGPPGTVRLLHRYFDCVTDVVQHRWGGYLNKFLGDGVLAIFGAPVEQSDHTRRAIESAIDYQSEVAKLNAELTAEFGEQAELSVRIGITSHEAMVGDCGSSDRMDYTAIGECVNLAARLEAANKYFGTAILLDDEAWRVGAGRELIARPLGRAVITGIDRPVALWNVLGRKSERDEALARLADQFVQLQELLAGPDYEQCCDLLEAILRDHPADGPAAVYLQHCRAALQSQVPYQPATEKTKGVERIVFPDRETHGPSTEQ